MYYWKGYNGYRVFWYNHKNYINNKDHTIAGSGTHTVFSAWWSNEIQLNSYSGYILGNNYDVSEYNNNFITSLPQNPILYFDKNTPFPRVKLELASIKRTLKPEKADAIVLHEKAQIVISNDSYTIFTDTVYIYAINNRWFKKDFNNNLDLLINDRNLGFEFHGPTSVLFCGRLLVIQDKTDTLKKFNNHEYNKPFILTNDLDRIVNENLPDLDLQAMNAIYEMLISTDLSIVKLGATMVSTFNVNKWILSTTILMYQDVSWFHCNSTAVKQLRRTLGLKRYTSGWWSIASEVQTNREEYNQEDILLAQEFVKGKPGFKEFCEQNKGFYLDFLPYIPDEYKQ